MSLVTATLSWSVLRRSSVRAAAAFVFPSRCLACERAPLRRFLRGGVCEGCWASVPLADGQRCRGCDEALAASESEVCGRCIVDPPAFASLRAAAPYRGTARDILLAFKFRGADFLAPRIAALMTERLAAPRTGASLERRSASPPDGQVVAVPGRRATSGKYSPSLLLGATVAARLGLPFLTRGITRARAADRQSGVAAARRARNVRGAFRAAPVAGDVLLVDDVATSGATVRECARALRRAGADRVDVWCFARASRMELAGAAGEDV